MREVIRYIERLQSLNVVRQYGLEQASFANHPSIVRYLPESGAELHGNASTSPDSTKKSDDKYLKELVDTRSTVRSLGRADGSPSQFELQLRVLGCVSQNKPVVKFLLKRARDLIRDDAGNMTIGAVRT